MKRIVILSFLALASLTFVAQTARSSGDRSKTLGSFKQEFLNQDVVVNDTSSDGNRCLEWNITKEKRDGRYEGSNFSKGLPLSYRGQTAHVVAIQLAEPFLESQRPAATNAFGETVSEDNTSDPYMDVVVRFRDNKLAVARGYATTLVPAKMELVSKIPLADFADERKRLESLGQTCRPHLEEVLERAIRPR